MLCLSVLFLGLVWRASNSISFLTLHLCPFLNANSYNAGPEETTYKTGCKNTKLSSLSLQIVGNSLSGFSSMVVCSSVFKSSSTIANGNSNLVISFSKVSFKSHSDTTILLVSTFIHLPSNAFKNKGRYKNVCI